VRDIGRSVAGANLRFRYQSSKFQVSAIMIQIRPLRKTERESAEGVVAAAFGRAEEAMLVRRLRGAGAVVGELCAFLDQEAVGHVLFSRLAVAAAPGSSPPQVAALAPLAVRPERQREGIGAALVQEGLAACRMRGMDAVLVLGDPAYYRRFGFSAELAAGVDAGFAGPAFMAVELVPLGLARARAVRYPSAFGAVH
jgi:putative acetyltransferase